MHIFCFSVFLLECCLMICYFTFRYTVVHDIIYFRLKYFTMTSSCSSLIVCIHIVISSVHYSFYLLFFFFKYFVHLYFCIQCLHLMPEYHPTRPLCSNLLGLFYISITTKLFIHIVYTSLNESSSFSILSMEDNLAPLSTIDY